MEQKQARITNGTKTNNDHVRNSNNPGGCHSTDARETELQISPNEAFGVKVRNCLDLHWIHKGAQLSGLTLDSQMITSGVYHFRRGRNVVEEHKSANILTFIFLNTLILSFPLTIRQATVALCG